MTNIFRYKELDYYFFGLYAGLRNFFEHGLSLGLRKTIGKILQPINSYTRFPEYFYMDFAIRRYLETHSFLERLRILDVGSPKCFGLFLASLIEADIELTDLNRLNLDEYEVMWKGLRKKAAGRATFAVQDARSLKYEDSTFDIVYSMSVLEHVEGDNADSESLAEMVRVLKPGGLILISVPFGAKYQEQRRLGFAGAAYNTHDNTSYFFQRIHDRLSLRKRIFDHMQLVQVEALWTAWRRVTPFLNYYGQLGENIRGGLGFSNPWLSAWLNQSCEGLCDSFESRYGETYSELDFFGDVILAGTKISTPSDGTT